MNTRSTSRRGRRLIHADDKESDKEPPAIPDESGKDEENPGAGDEEEKEETGDDVGGFDIENYLQDINRIEKDVVESDISRAAKASTDVTKAHSKRSKVLEDELVHVLGKIGEF